MKPKSSTLNLQASKLYDENTFYHKFTQDLLQAKREVAMDAYKKLTKEASNLEVLLL